MSSIAQLDLVEPTHLWVPGYEFTGGPEVGELCARADFGPDPEQQLVLDAIFAERDDGTPAVKEIEVVAPRQNIKTGVQLQTMIGWMFLDDVEQALYTAHKWKTAEKTFLALQAIVNGASFLKRRVRRFYEGNGEQKMVLTNGHLLEFSTRTNLGGRGPSPDKVILDEDFATTAQHVGSLAPSLATRPMAQLVRGSSAPHSTSTTLRQIMQRGHTAGDPFLAYFEWRAPDPAQACDLGEKCDHRRDTPGCGCDKPEMIAQGNSQYGRRIPADHVAWERTTMSPAEFGRDRMGWPDEPLTKAAELPPIDPDVWESLEDLDSRLLRVGAFAVEVSPERTAAAIVAVGPAPVSLVRGRPTGRAHVEVIEHGQGTGWIVPRALVLDADHGPAAWVIDGGGPASSLIKDFREAGLDVLVYHTDDVANAYAGLIDAIAARMIVHGPDPLLADAVAIAKKRSMGDGRYTIGRRTSDGDVTALLGVQLAHSARGELDYDVMDSIG